MFLGAAHGAPAPRSYAVMSLVGDTVHTRSLVPAYGNDAETNVLVPITDRVFDVSALTTANTAIQRFQPGAKVVALMTDDRGLYAAQNAMFDAPAANQENRAYLRSLLKERGVTHLILVTKLKANLVIPLKVGTTGTGSAEGLGILIDDTTWLRNVKTGYQHGLLAPFAYMTLRLLDADTLDVVAEAQVKPSTIIVDPMREPDAKSVWESLPTAKKVSAIESVLTCGLKSAIPVLLAAKTTEVAAAACQ
ncbi:MAG: hypothetical protein V4484_13195 [Pseudomonadota bacterium]